MNRSALKDWTEILTPWIQISALIAAGIFTLVEYRNSKTEIRVERAAKYLMRFAPEEVGAAQRSLSEREGDLKARHLAMLSADPKKTREQKNADYYELVQSHLATRVGGESLGSSVDRILGFLDDGAICVKLGQCDLETLRNGNSGVGPSIFRTYGPYICSQRTKWHDPDFGTTAEQFYNSDAEVEVCEGYKSAQELGSQELGESGSQQPLAASDSQN